jgi:hypothetical protein
VAFFWSVSVGVFGGLLFWLVRPEVNAHSVMGLFVIGGFLAFVVVMGIAGVGGAIAAGVLFFRFRVFSWRGVLAGVVGGGILFLLR